MKSPFTWAAVVFLVLIGLIHIARVAFGVTVVAGGVVVPVWLSAPAALFCLLLAFAVARETKRG